MYLLFGPSMAAFWLLLQLSSFAITLLRLVRRSLPYSLRLWFPSTAPNL